MVSAAALWTGGKDSALALDLAGKSGFDAETLVTFAPPKPEFLAHPLPIMRHQAELIGLPHKIITIEEPYKEAYLQGLKRLMEHGIEAIITGDIMQPKDHPDLIRECCEEAHLELVRPLWGMPREEIMRRLLEEKYEVMVSMAKKPWLDEKWVGRMLTAENVNELQKIKGLDLCGENGEYHTIVLYAPMFEKRIKINFHSTVTKGDAAHIEINEGNIH
jgi:diphthine-ammonia ligase